MAQLDREKYLTISALSKYISAKFDRDPYLQQIFVVGEISNYRNRPNTHQYFNLKDDNVQISAVMFKSAFSRIKFQLEEGMKVYARGRIQTYPQKGTYQIIIDSLEPDGLGAFYLAFEQLKAKLYKAGWFDQPKKRLPFVPKKIAIVTSPSGAVIRDIITTVQRRFPIVQLVVYPTRVQGEEAVGEIVSAFEEIERHSDEYDTVIVARGGGSIEDLWCFNDERVAEAILNCSLPVISSIGHETDTTIADLVADVRAATPTAAAEMAVPVFVNVLATINNAQERIVYAMTQRLNQQRKHLERYSHSYVLTQPDRLYQPFIQELDLLNDRLHHNKDRYLEQKQYKLGSLNQYLQRLSPMPRIQFSMQHLNNQTKQMNQSVHVILTQLKQQRQLFDQLLEAHSPLNTLARGYTITEQKDQIIHSVKGLNKGDILKIRFKDGHSQVTVDEIVVDEKEMENE